MLLACQCLPVGDSLVCLRTRHDIPMQLAHAHHSCGVKGRASSGSYDCPMFRRGVRQTLQALVSANHGMLIIWLLRAARHSAHRPTTERTESWVGSTSRGRMGSWECNGAHMIDIVVPSALTRIPCAVCVYPSAAGRAKSGPGAR